MAYKLKINDVMTPVNVYQNNDYIIYETKKPIFYGNRDTLKFSVLRHDNYDSNIYRLYSKPNIKSQNYSHSNRNLNLELYDNCKLICNCNNYKSGTITSKCRIFLRKI